MKSSKFGLNHVLVSQQNFPSPLAFFKDQDRIDTGSEIFNHNKETLNLVRIEVDNFITRW